MSQSEMAVTLTQTARRTAARWWFIAPTLFALVVVNQLDKTNMVVLAASREFLSDMGLVGQPGRIGMLTTVFFFGYGIGLLVWGFVVDRIGPRRSAMIGVCGWALTTIWCALSTSATELYAARFVLGLSEGCIWPVCNSYSGRWFPVQERARIQSVWVNANSVGIALGLPVVVYLMTAGGWQMVFWALGIGSFLLLQPILAFAAPDEPRRSRFANREETEYIEKGRRATPPKANSAGISPVLKDIRFWLITASHAVAVATVFGLAAWIPTYVTQVRGIPFRTLGTWVAVSYVVPIVIALLLGWVADRTMRPALVASISAVVLGFFVVGAVLVENPILSVLLLVTALAAPQVHAAMNATVLHGLAPPEQIGRGTGIFVGVANLTGGLGPFFLGYLIGLFSGQYFIPFGFIAALNLLLAVFYFSLDRRLKLRPQTHEAISFQRRS